MVATDTSLFNYFWQAGWVVKLVMLVLLAASVLSWIMIFQRRQYLTQLKEAMTVFESQFWAGGDMGALSRTLEAQADAQQGTGRIFLAGFNEYLRLKALKVNSTVLLESIQRAMKIAQAQEIENLEQSLSWLATIGSTAPYVGLLGTVWGIMTSFQALGGVQQATIAMVAPGISEALVATAMGLFAAIPAVIAYNRFSTEVGKIETQFDSFQAAFTNILSHQL